MTALSEEFGTSELVTGAIEGDVEARRRLYERHRDSIARLCRGYVGDPHLAEDAAQEIFLNIMGAETVPDNARAWMYRIARNHCLNVRRDRARRHDREPMPSEPQPTINLPGITSRLGGSELRARLMEALDAMHPTYSEPLRLRYGEDLNRRDVAYVLEISESVVKSRLFEGLEQIRAALGASGSASG